jgi:hypothetical protein
VQSAVEGRVRFTVDTPLGPVTKTVAVDKVGTKDWYDPIVGGRLLWNLSDHWMLGFRADVGGFTAASDFETNLEASLTYRINDRFFLNAAYRGYYDDYETGSGKDKFKYNIWAYGPWVGFGLRF